MLRVERELEMVRVSTESAEEPGVLWEENNKRVRVQLILSKQQ